VAGAKDRDDGESGAMLYDGASISQLTKLFDMDARDVSKKLRAILPCGTRRGFPIFNVKEAAKVLVPPEVDEEDILQFIGNMNFKNLPPALNKEVWNGLRARLRFEQEQGTLWPTERIQVGVNKLMQTVRMRMLLIPDDLERAAELNARQRVLIEKYVDSTLEELQQQIIEAMSGLDDLTPGIMDYTDKDDEDGRDDGADVIQEAGEEDFEL